MITMRSRLAVCWLLALLVLAFASVVAAGDGLVALQTGEASCSDESGDIYVDCGNGTVTDNRTGLVWLKNANCLNNDVTWFTAMEFVAGLADIPALSPAAAHDCGLSDGSSSGEWRLPSVAEWEAMIADAVALGCVASIFGGPSITSDDGATCWQEGPGNSFTGVLGAFYWSPATDPSDPVGAWVVFLHDGELYNDSKAISDDHLVWPVRGGQ